MWAKRIAYSKWNRGRSGLHQLGQNVAPSIPFPVCNPIYAQSRVSFVEFTKYKVMRPRESSCSSLRAWQMSKIGSETVSRTHLLIRPIDRNNRWTMNGGIVPTSSFWYIVPDQGNETKWTNWKFVPTRKLSCQEITGWHIRLFPNSWFRAVMSVT